MARLLLVSNRLPVTVRVEGPNVSVARSSGGLATGLSGPHERSGGLWIGWPGDVTRLSPAQRQQLDGKLAELRCVPLHLTASELSRFYEGLSNRVLWPLFHYLLDHVPEHPRHWETYRRVNERFADVVAEHYRDGDTLWVHDYQLMLVPKLLRERLPHARIGFFLHIPFPSSEVLRILPWRDELLEGVLGADLIGFHTLSYMRHFSNSLVSVLGLSPDADRVQYGGRTVRMGAFPMGIDAKSFATLAEREDTLAELSSLKASAQGERLLVGVDRLDYTKGIRRRLLAVDRLLEREPSLRGKIRFVQVAVPSRTEVVDYERHRQQVDALVGRINGAWGSAKWTPIHYLFRSIPPPQLVALFRAADVMLVTPLRDGMNLVAKEFIASRVDEDGVLLLSEFAGAASELGEAIPVNPYDVDGLAERIREALEMPEEERKVRMASMRRRVLAHDVHRWVKRFVDALESVTPEEASAAAANGGAPRERGNGFTPQAQVDALARELRDEKEWVLLLDYDGTLREFTAVPEVAIPDRELLVLLERLARRPGARVHVVSGRRHGFLDRYLGHLSVGLHAEHGLLSRDAPGQPWKPLRDVSTDWKDRVRPLLETFVDRMPGTFIEEKTASLAFHYRKAEPQYAAAQARELQLHLVQTFSNAPMTLLPGDRVLEVRAVGVSKANVVPYVMQGVPKTARVVAMGDDLTDEELFAALPEDAVALHVGPKPSRAPIRLRDVPQARWFLRRMLGDEGR